MSNDNEISLKFRSYTIFYDSHCIVLLLIYLVTWRWSSTRAETCRQPNNKENKI